MRVLLYRYGSICEPDVITGFRELGVEVVEETTEINNKKLTMQEQIKLVSNRLISASFDFVFSINFYPTLSEVCNIHHIPYLSWTVDSPVMELYTKSITNAYNRTFIFDYEDYSELEPLNPGHIFHLPLAASVALKDEANEKASEADKTRFSHDVAFVGSLYSEKNPYSRLKDAPAYLTGYLDGILESQLRVYGYNFMEKSLTDEIAKDFRNNFPGFYQLPGESFLTDKMTLARLYLGSEITTRERDIQMRLLSERFDLNVYTGSDTSMYPRLHNRGFAKTLTEMPVIFRNSKINLSTTSRSIRSGISLRIWDILGAGGFCLTNYQSELFNYFDDGVHLASYGSLDEMVSKCEYYLSHEDERREIAHTGYEYVKNNHTFTIRMAQMMKMAFPELFGDAGVGVSADEGKNPILIYLPGDMCYGVLERFAKLLGQAFEMRGEEVIYFDTTGDNFSKIGDYIGKKFKYIFGFQSYMFSLKTVSGDYVHDLIEGEKYNFYFDHPIKGREHLGDCCKSTTILTLDENYVNFIKEHYGLSAAFCPPAGELFAGFKKDEKGIIKNWEDRKYTLSFLGSYGSGFHGYLSELMAKPRSERILYNHLFKIIKHNPDLPSELAFEQAMKEVIGEYSESEFMDAFGKAATMLRMISHHYREKIIKTILAAGIELHVFGDSWSYSPFAGLSNLIIHPEVREDEAARVFAESKLSLNIMSWHKGGFTERMESALLNGSLLVTDRSDYTDEYLEDGNQLIVFSLNELDKLPGKIKAMIDDEETSKRVAENGLKWARENPTSWDDIADIFVD